MSARALLPAILVTLLVTSGLPAPAGASSTECPPEGCSIARLYLFGALRLEEISGVNLVTEYHGRAATFELAPQQRDWLLGGVAELRLPGREALTEGAYTTRVEITSGSATVGDATFHALRGPSIQSASVPAVDLAAAHCVHVSWYCHDIARTAAQYLRSASPADGPAYVLELFEWSCAHIYYGAWCSAYDGDAGRIGHNGLCRAGPNLLQLREEVDTLPSQFPCDPTPRQAAHGTLNGTREPASDGEWDVFRVPIADGVLRANETLRLAITTTREGAIEGEILVVTHSERSSDRGTLTLPLRDARAPIPPATPIEPRNGVGMTVTGDSHYRSFVVGPDQRFDLLLEGAATFEVLDPTGRIVAHGSHSEETPLDGTWIVKARGATITSYRATVTVEDRAGA